MNLDKKYSRQEWLDAIETLDRNAVLQIISEEKQEEIRIAIDEFVGRILDVVLIQWSGGVREKRSINQICTNILEISDTPIFKDEDLCGKIIVSVLSHLRFENEDVNANRNDEYLQIATQKNPVYCEMGLFLEMILRRARLNPTPIARTDWRSYLNSLGFTLRKGLMDELRTKTGEDLTAYLLKEKLITLEEVKTIKMPMPTGGQKGRHKDHHVRSS